MRLVHAPTPRPGRPTSKSAIPWLIPPAESRDMAQQSHLFVSQRPPSHSSGPCAVHEPHVTPHHTHRCACSALPRAHRSILLLRRIPAPRSSLWHSPAPAHARDKPSGVPAPRCSAGFTGSGVAQWARVPASKSAHGGERQSTPLAHVTEQDTPRRGPVKRCTMTPMWLCVDVHLIGSQVVLTADVITSILTRPRAHSRTPHTPGVTLSPACARSAALRATAHGPGCKRETLLPGQRR
jgi:hypothetical protein